MVFSAMVVDEGFFLKREGKFSLVQENSIHFNLFSFFSQFSLTSVHFRSNKLN